MYLGKITFRIENKNPKWFFCRPVSNNRGSFISIRGICQVVYVEKCDLIENLNIDDEVTTYAIFHKTNTQEAFDRSFCHINISPITEEIYNRLLEIYPQKEHAFSV